MKPKPFIPEAMDAAGLYVRDKTGGLVWHCSRMRPLYADTDRSQVVYHANFLRYFEFGRASLMRDAAYSYREIEESGTIYPIIQIGVDYFSPVHYDDPMCIYTRPALLERVRLRFEYVVTHEQTRAIACTGFTRHCAVNARGTPVAIDEKTAHLWRVFPR
ncbi:MAG: thioesterase family protein [Desulfobacterales bacterium]